MTYGNAHFRRWLRVCAACLAAFYALSLNAQSVTAEWTSAPGTVSENSTKVTVTLGSISGNLPGLPTTTRDVTISWVYEGRNKAGGSTTPAANWYVGGVLYSGRSGPTKATGSMTKQITTFTDDGTGRLRTKMYVGITNSGSGGYNEVWIYADARYEMTVHLNNTGSTKPAVFKAIQDGNEIAQWSVAPNTMNVRKIVTTSPSPITITRETSSYQLIDGTFYKQPNPPEYMGTGSPGDRTGENPPLPPDFHTPAPPSGSAGDDSPDEPVWEFKDDTTGNLREGVFKEGVANIVKAIKESAAVGGGGGDLTVNVNVSGVESRLDDVKTNTKTTADLSAEIKEVMDRQKASATGGEFNNENVGPRAENAFNAIVAVADLAANSMQTAVDEAQTSLGLTLPDSPVSPGPADAGLITIPISQGRTVTLPKNPFSSSGPFGGLLATVTAFVKKLIAWGIVAAFVIWAHKRLQEMIEAPFNTAPFGTSLTDTFNSVKIAGFGGGWGILARAAACSILIPLLLSLPLIGTAALTAGLPWGEVKSIFSAGVGSLPSGGMMGQAISMSDQVIPWATILAAPIWYFTVQYVLFPSKIFWMLFIKFVAI